MSRDLIPAHIRAELEKRADRDCRDCHGDGYVTFTARNAHGYTEVRCACVDRERETDEDAA